MMTREPALFTWKLLDHPELLKQGCETHGIDEQEFRARIQAFYKETAELHKKSTLLNLVSKTMTQERLIE